MRLVDELKQIISSDKISIDPNVLDAYSHDRYKDQKVLPNVVIFPNYAQEIQAILQFANKLKISITPRGTGTNSTGAATPMKSGIVLSLEKMNRILELDLVNKIIIVEPGVLTGDIHKIVEEKGLFYPPDPGSLAECTIGGNIATNAGGARALKYGVTRNYVLGLEGFFANGDHFKLGGKQFKKAVGYDMLQLLIGSEGTLGIVSKIWLRLIDLPKFQQNLLILHDSFTEILEIFNSMKQTNLSLATVEFMDTYCLEAASKYLKKSNSYANKVGILIQLDNNYQSAMDADLQKIVEICDQFKVKDVQFAETKKQIEALWQTRRCLAYAFSELFAHKKSYDIVVPPSEISNYMNFLADLNRNSQLLLVGFGHLGDGNIHVNILQKDKNDELWQKETPNLTLTILNKAIALGGNISGEHGIGLVKKDYLKLNYANTELDYMKKIKQIFDPNGILNPGKIF